MIVNCCCDELWDMIDIYIGKAFGAMTQESVVRLIIQGVLIAFSVWDKNSRFFVLLAAIGLYSVYGSMAVRVSLRRLETAVRKISEAKRRQFSRTVEVRRGERFEKRLHIPKKERRFYEKDYLYAKCIKPSEFI